MGQKVNPIGFRLGVYRNWDARWYADKEYTKLLHEDIAMRRLIGSRLRNAGLARIETERSANQLTVIIQTAKPGIVIGKQGASVDALRDELERISGKKVRVTIHEIKTPELDATLVAENVASQLEKRIAFRRALKQTLMRSMRAGAKGVKIQVSGRLGGSEMSRREWDRDGRVPLHTLRANIDYGKAEARTTFGRIGVQCWLYLGDFVTATGEPIAPGKDRAEDRGLEDRVPVPAARVAEAPAEEVAVAAEAIEVPDVDVEEAPAEDVPEIDEDEAVIVAAGVDPAAGAEKVEKLDSQAGTGASQTRCGQEAHVRRPRTQEAGQEGRRTRRWRRGRGGVGMLMPKRTKHRKLHRGRRTGAAQRGNKLDFGTYGLQATEQCWMTNRQIEAARRAMTRHVKRGGKIWIRVFPDHAFTKKPAETRMGSGKGQPEGWVAVVLPGRVLFEMAGVTRETAQEAMRLAAFKLPIKTRFLIREETGSDLEAATP